MPYAKSGEASHTRQSGAAIGSSLGRTNANTVILEAQFNFAPNTTFAAAANQTVATAQSLLGTAAAASVRAAFHARGII